MKIIDPAHIYELQNFEGESTQILKFIKKEPSKNDSTVLETVMNGTTTEEVLDVLIDRTMKLQAKFPCEENEKAIEGLKIARFWFDRRTTRRIEKGVEGKQLKH